MKAWMRKCSKRIGVFGAAAAVVIVSLTLVTAQPAAAGCGWEKTFYYKGDTGQVDNCPYNGASSWAWLYNGSNDNKGLALWVQFYDGTGDVIGGISEMEGLSQDFWGGQQIWRAQLIKYDYPGTNLDYGPIVYM